MLLLIFLSKDVHGYFFRVRITCHFCSYGRKEEGGDGGDDDDRYHSVCQFDRSIFVHSVLSRSSFLPRIYAYVSADKSVD